MFISESEQKFYLDFNAFAQKFVLLPNPKQSWSPFHDVSGKWDGSYKQEMLSVLKMSLSVCSYVSKAAV